MSAEAEIHVPSGAEVLEAFDPGGDSLGRVRLVDLSKQPGWHSARRHSEAGRAALQQLDTVVAARHFEQGREAYAALDVRLTPALDFEALAFVTATTTSELHRARWALAQARALAERLPGHAPLLSYYEGLLERAQAAWPKAVRAFHAAEQGFEAWGRSALQLGALEMRAVTLRDLGRGGEALAALEGARDLAEAAEPCARARFETNLGWVRYLERSRRGPGAASDPEVAFEAALRHGKGCASGEQSRNLAINRALAALQNGDVARARALAPIATASVSRSGRVGVWERDLRARLAAAGGDRAQAREEYRSLTALEGPLGDDAAWRGHLGLGELHLADGEASAALEAFLRAESALDRIARRVPVLGGRTGLLADRARSLVGVVRSGMASERLARVFCAVRMAQRRSRAQLVQRARIDRLGEADRERWRSLLQSYHRIRARIVEEVEDDWRRSEEELARALAHREEELAELEGVQERLLNLLDLPARSDTCGQPAEQTEVVWAPSSLEGDGVWLSRRGRRVWTGQPRSGPWLALAGPTERFRGLATFSARWSLDLPPLPRTPSERVVVISDPRGDLRGARGEGRRLVEIYRRAGLDVTHLEGRAATWEAVWSALPGAAVLHYAGHAEAEQGWLLANDAVMTAADLLTLESSPRFVVLSGCETAPSDGVGLTVAEALLLGGSGAAIASPRPVADADGPGPCLAEAWIAYEGDAERAWKACELAARRAGYELWLAHPGANRLKAPR